MPRVLLGLVWGALLLGAPANAFLYQPGSPSGQSIGEIWDPSITFWRGRWFAHAMYQAPGLRTNDYRSGWLAVSDDGCHWQDGGPVAPEHPGGDQWFKGRLVSSRSDLFGEGGCGIARPWAGGVTSAPRGSVSYPSTPPQGSFGRYRVIPTT